MALTNESSGWAAHRSDRIGGQLQVCSRCNRVFYCYECFLEHRHENNILPGIIPVCWHPRQVHPAIVCRGVFIPGLELATCPHLKYEDTDTRAQRLLNWLNLARDLLIMGYRQLPQFRHCLRLSRLAATMPLNVDLILAHLRPFLGPQPLRLPSTAGDDLDSLMSRLGQPQVTSS